MSRAVEGEIWLVLLWLSAFSARIGLTTHPWGGLAYVKPGKWRLMWACHCLELVAITSLLGNSARIYALEWPSAPVWSRWVVASACIMAVAPCVYGSLFLGRLIEVRIKGWPARAVTPLLPVSCRR